VPALLCVAALIPSCGSYTIAVVVDIVTRRLFIVKSTFVEPR